MNPTPALKPLRHPPPTCVRTKQDLEGLQRYMMHALIQPLSARDKLTAKGPRAESMEAVAAKLIKPTRRLSPAGQLQIYARSYWYRLLNFIGDEFPALGALLGPARFEALSRAYLTRYPSRSHTLHDLCAGLASFILEEPPLTSPRTGLAHAIAQFERAQKIAAYAGSRPPLTQRGLTGARGQPRIALQPCLVLLCLDWPVERFVLAIRQHDADHSEAARATIRRNPTHAPVFIPRQPRRVWLVVHRRGVRLFHKRVSAPEFAMLRALAAGGTLAAAAAAAGPRTTLPQVRQWLATWVELGWLCRPTRGRHFG